MEIFGVEKYKFTDNKLNLKNGTSLLRLKMKELFCEITEYNL